MAQIPRYEAQQTLNPDAGGMPQPVVGSPMGEALQGLGRQVGNVATVLQRKQEQEKQKDAFRASSAYRKLQLDLGQQLDEAEQNIAPDGSDFHDQFVRDIYRPERDKFLTGLSPEMRERYEILLDDNGPDSSEWSIKAATKERDQTYRWYEQEIGVSQQQLATAIASNPDEYDKLLDAGMSEIDASGLPTDKKMQQRDAWERMAQVSFLNRMMEQDPEGVLKSLGADPRYLSPTTQFESLKKALVVQESGGDPNAVSPKGAIGIMQVMPGTARDIAKEIGDKNFNPNWDPTEVEAYLSNATVNQRYGDYYLKKQIRDFAATGGIEAALVAYNGGPERAKAWIKSNFDDKVLPAETRKYYKAVMARLPGYRENNGKGDPRAVQIVFDRAGRSAVSGQNEELLSQDLTERVKASFAALGLDKVRVTSGYRSREDNDRVGGARRSEHLHGNAVDIDVSGYSTSERIQLIRSLSANGITGLGIGSNIIHADLGGWRAWGYATSAGGGSVPKWAQPAIGDHLTGASTVPQGAGRAVGASARFATLPYETRQQFIQSADNAVTKRYETQSKETAVQRVELKSAMENELASIRRSGQSTGAVDDTRVSTVLGEDDYVKWVGQKQQAQRLYVATSGIPELTVSQMDERLRDYEPVPGSPTYADDVQTHTAVQKEIDRVQRLRATRPDQAALEFPEVKAAFAKVQEGVGGGNLNPDDAQAFVRSMIDRQREFNLKPGSEAPVPRDWGLTIGKALARIPSVAKADAADVTSSLLIQYNELKKVFGDYTEEVIIYALSEYKGMDKDTAELAVSFMQSIESGGDPFNLKPKADKAEDQAQTESILDKTWNWVSDFWAGEDDAAPEDAGAPDVKAPDGETILRAVNALNSAETPEEESDIVRRYGQAAVDAAKRRIEAGRVGE